jgi:6-pyruvoyltetrahydropterin/6-carboxytetrahydropterin synthase
VQIKGAELEQIQPADAPAVQVEVFANWLHGQLAGALGELPGVTLAVRIWESPAAFAGYTASLDPFEMSSSS